MNRKFGVLLVALVVLNILDGDFKTPSVLDIVKMVLFIICLALLISEKKEGKA